MKLNELCDEYIKSMIWSEATTEEQKALAIDYIRSFCAFLEHRWEVTQLKFSQQRPVDKQIKTNAIAGEQTGRGVK